MDIPYLTDHKGKGIENGRINEGPIKSSVEWGMNRNLGYNTCPSMKNVQNGEVFCNPAGYEIIEKLDFLNFNRNKEDPGKGNFYNLGSNQKNLYQTTYNQGPPRYDHENSAIESRGYQTNNPHVQRPDHFLNPQNENSSIGLKPDYNSKNLHNYPSANNGFYVSSSKQDFANIAFGLPQIDSDPPPLGKPPDLMKFSIFNPHLNSSRVQESQNKFPNIIQPSLPQNNCIVLGQNIPFISNPPQVFNDFSESDPKLKQEIEKTIKASRIMSESNMMKSIQITQYKKIVPPFNHAQINNYQLIQLATTIESSDSDTPVNTVSACWIEIEKMKDFGRYNQNFVYCIDQLIHRFHIIGWKKSRGDGDCYYRSVISKYLEIIFGFYSQVSNGEFFLSILRGLEAKGIAQNLEPEFGYSLEMAILWVKSLLELKRNDPSYAFHSVLTWLQYAEFDRAFVFVARLLTYSEYLERQEELSLFLVDDDPNALVQIILTLRTEAESLVLLLLPAALKIQVIQFNIFSNERVVNVINYPEDGEYEIKVNIIRRPGHYDILYTSAEQQSDLYDFGSSTYYYARS